MSETDDPFGRSDDQPPGRGVRDLAGLGVLTDHAVGFRELVRRLQGENLDARKPSFGKVGQRSGRWDLDQGGDSDVPERLHAQVPANGVADLGDQAVQELPAATTWPPPLLFAAVSPCLASTCATSSGSPPRTALMPVGVTLAASAISLPRSRTNTMACSAVMTPAAQAAVISPTE